MKKILIFILLGFLFSSCMPELFWDNNEFNYGRGYSYEFYDYRPPIIYSYPYNYNYYPFNYHFYEYHNPKPYRPAPHRPDPKPNIHHGPRKK